MAPMKKAAVKSITKGGIADALAAETEPASRHIGIPTSGGMYQKMTDKYFCCCCLYGYFLVTYW